MELMAITQVEGVQMGIQIVEAQMGIVEIQVMALITRMIIVIPLTKYTLRMVFASVQMQMLEIPKLSMELSTL